MALTNDQIVFGVSVFLIDIAFLMYYFRRIGQGHLVEVRKVAALTGIEESAGRCAEMGQIYAVCAMGALNGARAHATAAAHVILGYALQMCARTGAEPLIPMYSAPETLPMKLNILENAYATEGRIEEFRPDMIRQVSLNYSSSWSPLVTIGALIQRENIGATCWVGNISNVNAVIADIDGICIQGTGSTNIIVQCAVFSDYTFLGEELHAGACYISPEPIMVSSLRGMDLTKCIVIGMVLILLPVYLAGALPF